YRHRYRRPSRRRITQGDRAKLPQAVARFLPLRNATL
ncbi:hypothetical protein ALC62_05288, partial [Cyphomyrmex costatus]